MLVIQWMLLKIVESQFSRVHYTIKIDVQDLEIWFLRIGVRIFELEHGVRIGYPGVCDNNVNALAWGISKCRFEHLQLIIPRTNVTLDKLDVSVRS